MVAGKVTRFEVHRGTPAPPLRRSRRASVAMLLFLLLACAPGDEGERLLWASRPEPLHVDAPQSPLPESVLHAAPLLDFGIGNLVRHGDDLWLPEVVPSAAGPEIRVLRLGPSVPPGEARPVARFHGTSPGLLALEDGALLLVHAETARDSTRLVVRRGDSQGAAWRDPVRIAAVADTLPPACGPPIVFASSIVFPAVWRQSDDEAMLVVHASRDGGASWNEAGRLRVPARSEPRLAALADTRLLLALRTSGMLAACTSADSGRTWSAFNSTGVRALAQGFALARSTSNGEVALAWTDPMPDSTIALPGLQALRVATSADGGTTWSAPRRLVLWPGRVPMSASLALDSRHLVAAFADAPSPGAAGRGPRVACMGWDRAARAATRDSTAGEYGIDPRAARAALRLLCAHNLARPTAPQRLFVEGYCMRTLAAAYAVFDSLPEENPEWFETGALLETALAWSDGFVAAQDEHGYWPIGYGAVFIADMAAAVGAFHALAPHAGDARLAKYEAAARKFATALARDGMILPSGAVGVGWWGTTLPRNERRASRDPYLVSTALAGIEVHAWLHRRSGEPEDRKRALQALDYTLSQMQPDGSLAPGPHIPGGVARESPLVTAVYVEEGWMAADLLLADPELRSRLSKALAPHVEWLLRLQQPDGRWDQGADGEFARTPAILNFLIWYDQRCERRADVRRAVRRGGAMLVDWERWDEIRFMHAGNHYDVQRAVAGRPLAALGSGKFVL